MVAPLLPEIASRWIESGVIEQLIEAQRQVIAERLYVAKMMLKDVPHNAAPDSPFVWMSLPEPWRAGQFSSALRQAGVLVRTADHFAVGRSPAPHAVRISLNAANSVAEIEAGLRVILAVLQSGAGAPMEP